MKNFKTTVKIKKEDVVGLFISACEGGSNYWCQSLAPIVEEKDAYTDMLKGFKLKDGESGKTYRISPKRIERAVQLFATKAPYEFGKLLSDDSDASTGDAFLQLCTFGDVIYG